MRQFLCNFIILQLLLLTLVFPISSLAASGGRLSRGKKKINIKDPKEINLCDIQGQLAPIYCYCNSIAIHNATDANCLVLTTFTRNNSVWSSFKSQLNLEKLTFSVRQTDGLDYIPTQLLKLLTHLYTIGFQYARINELEERAFSDLHSVSEINLSRNTITVLRKYAFENMRNLTTINLDENRISEINRYPY